MVNTSVEKHYETYTKFNKNSCIARSNQIINEWVEDYCTVWKDWNIKFSITIGCLIQNIEILNKYLLYKSVEC